MANRAKTGSPKFARRLKYAWKCLPGYAWQRLVRHPPSGRVHLILALADHFEPSSMPSANAGFAPRHVQESRLERWCEEYPKNFEDFLDHDGRRFTHTYFYPAEQYDPEIVGFRDALAHAHGCLSYADGDSTPKYVFVHGNFALANCAGGYACGVDNEMQILAQTGCYADMTYPTSAFHPAQIAKINSLYECSLPLERVAPQRRGRRLAVGRPVSKFPFVMQGPWMIDFDRSRRRWGGIENGSLTHVNPPSLSRLVLWRRAGITIQGRPDWIFIKLHTQGMDPLQTDTVLRGPMQSFLSELIRGAEERREVLHFVSAREMANIALAACDGREGDPADYRDYRYRLFSSLSPNSRITPASSAGKV